MEEKKFYYKPWFIWLSLVIFAPLGIFLLWKSKRYPKVLSIIITILSAILFIIIWNSVSSNDIDNTDKQVASQSTVNNIILENNVIEDVKDTSKKKRNRRRDAGKKF